MYLKVLLHLVSLPYPYNTIPPKMQKLESTTNNYNVNCLFRNYNCYLFRQREDRVMARLLLITWERRGKIINWMEVDYAVYEHLRSHIRIIVNVQPCVNISSWHCCYQITALHDL